jgi:hypothetical protein
MERRVVLHVSSDVEFTKRKGHGGKRGTITDEE